MVSPQRHEKVSGPGSDHTDSAAEQKQQIKLTVRESATFTPTVDLSVLWFNVLIMLHELTDSC